VLFFQKTFIKIKIFFHEIALPFSNVCEKIVKKTVYIIAKIYLTGTAAEQQFQLKKLVAWVRPAKLQFFEENCIFSGQTRRFSASHPSFRGNCRDQRQWRACPSLYPIVV
jgi:hypothetical protein